MPPLPTVDEVKNLPISPVLLLIFFAIPDDKVQAIINLAAGLLGSNEAKRHTQWTEAVLYLSAHLLYIQLSREGGLPGAGGAGGVGPVSSRKLDGVGQINYAVAAFTPGQLADWFYAQSPWSVCLMAILDTFPPGISTTAFGEAGIDGLIASANASWFGVVDC